jgi:hypothetical protein
MSNVSVFSYASSNVSTSAYTTLVVATPIAVSHLQIVDTSGELLQLAYGLAGSEIPFAVTPIGGTVVLPIQLPAGVRIAAKAITNTAANGYNALSFLNA